MLRNAPLVGAPASSHPSSATIILGIDPGLQRTGYAVVAGPATSGDPALVEAGVIRLPRQQPLAERLMELETSLATILDLHHPHAVACEELYSHYKHPRTAILMAHARGVILALAARRGLAIVSVAATNAKKLLTGNGHASKRQIQQAVAATLHLLRLPEPPDVADAIAIALAGARLRRAEMADAASRNRSPR
jgi:crossover junction endodeoxyribonuclease RuvC